MKFRQYLISAALAALAVCSANAQQPYGGCWHPDDIKNWSPENDPDAKFNRSRVPLAQRFKEPTLMKANANQYYEGQVCNATILFNMCSLSPSQGANNFLGYQPTYWQYMDKLVYWAGSASEGIIIPPPAGSIDAAHAQGVKVLGQIFFPPSAFGGNQAWVRQMLSKEGGKYIYAIKLYEIAKYFGFDGWFINEESGGGSTDEWVGFIKEFNAAADAGGDTQMEIQWYNASRTPNKDILTTHKNTSQFLEYGSAYDNRAKAAELGCTEAEIYGKIYSGVETVKAGLTGYNSYLNGLFPTTGHVGSIDLFCPEEHIWKDNVRNLLGTSDDNGAKAYEAIQKTFANEELVWVNQAGDPSNITNTTWRGLSGAVLERSVITQMPFISNMCVGVGKYRFVNGKKEGVQDWYHSGIQSILPTWRWWIENRGSIKVAIDWDDAYNHGSSFKFTDIAAGDHLVRLYKTMIPVNDNAVVKIAYKGGAAPELKLSTVSTTTPDVTLSASSTANDNGWSVATYNLTSVKGKTIYMIGLNLNNVGTTFSLGQIAVLPASYSPAAVTVSNLNVNSGLGETKGDIRITWDFDWSADFDHFDVYTKDFNGVRTLVGQTRDEAFYIPNVVRQGNENSIDVEIVPVMKDSRQQTPVVGTANYPQATAPVVSFKLSKSYIKVGETATITATGTGAPTAWAWTLPDGLELVSGQLTDNVITVKGVKEGRQSVTVNSTNAIGSSTTTREVIDVLSADDYAAIHNVALKKTIVSYSGCTNDKETPANLIDGITNPQSTSAKWCNVSPSNWVIIDCEGVYRMYGFKIFDCKAGPENAENIKDYTIELSMDGKNWTKVVDEEGRDADNIKEDYIAPYKARYIRFSPTVSGTLRVWEFEAYGVDDVNFKIEVAPAELRVNTGETKNVTLTYDLNGDARETEFYVDATAGDNITIGEITENEADKTFTIPVTGGEMIGETTLVVKLFNGGAYKEKSVRVVVDSDNLPNVLSGETAILRQFKNDYSYEAEYSDVTANTLTDGNLTEEGCMVIETPSTHKDDFWVIFTAEDSWNLSKVKVYIPNANQGENDNGKAGAVNNEITIAVGNDLTSMNRVKTFSNLGEVSELEYIFPEYKNCKYLAIICNLNPYFYPSLAEVEAYEQVESAIPALAPVEISNWQHDAIAESKPVRDFADTALDDQGWVLYTSDITATGAIAGADRMVRSAKGTPFRLADYAAKNSLVIKERYKPQTLNFAQSANCEKIFILAISANGTSRLEVTPVYEDGEGEPQEFSIADWFSASADGDEAVYGLGRIMWDQYGTDDYETGDIDSRKNFRLYELEIPTDASRKVKGVKFESLVRKVYPTILAISKLGTSSSGIDDIISEDAEKEIVGIYTIQGMQVQNPSNGLFIIRYSDGSARKVIIR